ncbi:hypothetical protein GGR53DRAFT_532185 [Hypoxylon sp. FL1150]|nr:hypothetical protein GGR53DRAFT_532185 [Hypoxylon sp. FL1150]
MTTPVSGSSLPQARDVHEHNRFHNTNTNSSSGHNHLHNHLRTHQHHARSHHRDASTSSQRGRKRADSEPTVIVETVSVLQVIDSTGSTSLQTLSQSTPTTALLIATTTAATASDAIVDSSSGGVVSVLGLPTSTSTPGTSDDEGDGLQSQSTYLSAVDPTVTPSASSMPTSFPTLSYSPLTSTPLSGSPVFPSLAGVTNTTQAVPTSSLFPSSNSTTTASSSTILPFSAESFNGTSSSSTSSSSLASSSSSSFSSSGSLFSSATTTSSSFDSASTTFGSFGTASATETGDGTLGAGGNAASTSSSTAAAAGATDSSSSSGPGAATVAGSVLGGVAALAFVLILALGLLRWKRRQNTLKLLRGATSDRDAGGGLVGNSGPGGGGGGPGMSEQRTGPFAVPAALASLTGYKRFSGRSAASADDGERGFSKISGRKLPPVLQFGGDGFSDPRDTMMSDQSIEYRDSQAFPGLMGSGPTRLAVGAPMRPDSGVPVFNAGPARTPIHEQGPFLSSPFSDDSALEPPRRDPLGRSHPSYDGSNRSHGSASRFTEVI